MARKLLAVHVSLGRDQGIPTLWQEPSAADNEDDPPILCLRLWRFQGSNTCSRKEDAGDPTKPREELDESVDTLPNSAWTWADGKLANAATCIHIVSGANTPGPISTNLSGADGVPFNRQSRHCNAKFEAGVSPPELHTSSSPHRFDDRHLVASFQVTHFTTAEQRSIAFDTTLWIIHALGATTPHEPSPFRTTCRSFQWLWQRSSMCTLPLLLAQGQHSARKQARRPAEAPDAQLQAGVQARKKHVVNETPIERAHAVVGVVVPRLRASNLWPRSSPQCNRMCLVERDQYVTMSHIRSLPVCTLTSLSHNRLPEEVKRRYAATDCGLDAIEPREETVAHCTLP